MEHSEANIVRMMLTKVNRHFTGKFYILISKDLSISRSPIKFYITFKIFLLKIRLQLNPAKWASVNQWRQRRLDVFIAGFEKNI